MFSVALFKIAKKKLTCLLMDEWKKKMWYYIYNSGLKKKNLKKKEIFPFVTIGMNLENIMLNEL